MDIHRACFAQKVLAPDRGQQLLTSECTSGAGHECVQQLIFLERELHAASVGGDGVLRKVHLKSAYTHKLWLHIRRLSAAAQHRAHARGHLHHAEGLCKIVVRAEVKTDNLVILITFSGGHYYGDISRALIGLQAL